MKTHLVVLVALTIIVQGILFLAYPVGGNDDNQAGQRYLVDRLLAGDLRIGNLRYNTGYPFAIAPVFAAAQRFGSATDRVVLLIQTALASTIPFFVYDIVRRQRAPTEAFVVALVVLLDPFGLQVAHFWLPEWWVAVLLVASLWLIQRALAGDQRSLLRQVALAGLLLGTAVLARLNFAPVVVVIGLSFLALRRLQWRVRLQMLAVLGAASAGLIGAYTLLIQIPSTGTARLSCIGASNLMAGIYTRGVPTGADNGPVSAEILRLLALRPLREIIPTADTYPLWQLPGAWVPADEQTRFLAQTSGPIAAKIDIGNPFLLYFYLGPCPTDDLYARGALEALRRYPALWLSKVAQSTAAMLTLTTVGDRLLPPANALVFTEPDPFGFARATGASYTGENVWLPGIRLFDAISNLLAPLRLLTPIAAVLALCFGGWFYRTSAVALLVFLLFLSAAHGPSARLASAVYPLYSVVIGFMLAAIIRAGLTRWHRRSTRLHHT